MKVEVRIGSILLHLEPEDLKEMIEQISFLTELPDHCPLCAEELGFFHRVAKQYNFYGLRCKGSPVHESTFGQYKDLARGFFYKGSGSWGEAQWGKVAEEEAEHTASQPAGAAGHCEEPGCGVAMTTAQVTLSRHKFGTAYCVTHQKERVAAEVAQNASTAKSDAPATGNGKAVAPPPAKPPAAPRPATKKERDEVLMWVEYANDNSVTAEAEYGSLLSELGNPATTLGRIQAIYEDLKERCKEVEAGEPEPA